MGVHGGHEETSVMLHLRPDLVDMTQARRWVPEHLAGYRHVRFGGSVSFGWSSDDFGPAGVIGDASGGDRRGRRRAGRGRWWPTWERRWPRWRASTRPHRPADPAVAVDAVLLGCLAALPVVLRRDAAPAPDRTPAVPVPPLNASTPRS